MRDFDRLATKAKAIHDMDDEALGRAVEDALGWLASQADMLSEDWEIVDG